MKGLLSIRLAWSGIQKNRKLYLPYCLTIIGMVMMSYIMQALSYAPALHAMKGGSNLEAILSLGKLVIAVFALAWQWGWRWARCCINWRSWGL